MSFQLSSPAFAEASSIPQKYSHNSQNASPPLTIGGIPNGAASLALIMHDPDAPGGDYLHWTIWNLSPNLTTLNENEIPANAVQGKNDFGKIGYDGPAPPSGTHHYLFVLYALDARLNLREGADRDEISEAITNHIITQTTLVGTFSAA